jgi:hypothetical protein
MTMSLIKHPDAIRSEKNKAVASDLTSLRSWARDYNNRYEDEIKEGTEKRQLLLTEGLRKGVSKDKIDFGPNFIPSNETPILNFLFFHKRDEDYSELDALREIKDVGKKEEFLREQYNKTISEGAVEDKLDKFENPLQPNLGKYIYGDVDVDMFEKIKKLKSLSNSPNESEAFSAYRMAKKLCEKHKLDFDRIPCDN